MIGKQRQKTSVQPFPRMLILHKAANTGVGKYFAQLYKYASGDAVHSVVDGAVCQRLWAGLGADTLACSL